MTVLAALGYGALGTYALWLWYLAVMSLKRARDAGRLSRVAYVMGLPILWSGLLIDCAVNLAVATILFLELPREWLVTARLSRLAHNGGWRARLALWICANLLDQFDPDGHHCNCADLH